MRLDDRPVKFGAREGIGEALLEPRERLGAAVQRDSVTERLGDRAEVIDAVHVVAMVVRDDHRVDLADIRGEQLLAKVGPAVDENALSTAFDQDRRAHAGVARLIGVALPPIVADLGDSGRRPAAENADFHASALWAFLNSLKKLAVVASPSASVSSPRNSATKAAVSATNAGSHFWPRCGTGARNGASVSTSIWSAGSHFAMSWRSWAFLKVTIPLSETKKPRSRPLRASPAEPVKQWRTPATPPPLTAASRISAVSSSASRVWTTSGRPVCRAASICASNRSRCAARSDLS